MNPQDILLRALLQTVRFFTLCSRGFSVSQQCFLMEWSFSCDDHGDDADDDDSNDDDDDDDDATSGFSH